MAPWISQLNAKVSMQTFIILTGTLIICSKFSALICWNSLIHSHTHVEFVAVPEDKTVDPSSPPPLSTDGLGDICSSILLHVSKHKVALVNLKKLRTCDWQIKTTQSARYHQHPPSAPALYFQPLCPIQYHSISRSTRSTSPLSSSSQAFFWFPFVPSFSRLPPQLSVCGQRSTARSQVPAGTAATRFMHRRHKLQMWPFAACRVTCQRAPSLLK